MTAARLDGEPWHFCQQLPQSAQRHPLAKRLRQDELRFSLAINIRAAGRPKVLFVLQHPYFTLWEWEIDARVFERIPKRQIDRAANIGKATCRVFDPEAKDIVH